jgi:hypothetical protein
MAEKGNKYSVYQGLDSDPQINWGTVATTISKQLKSLRDLKVAERDAIDKATQDQMDQLNKLPDVNDRSLNKIIMEASDNSKQYLLREAALVKRGLRKPKDYSLFLQSQKNGYSEFGNVVKNWDKWNQAKMEALATTDQSALDAFTAEDIASFGNLKDKTIMTNPANGQIQVVSMGKDKNGNYTVMPNALKNPGAFNNPASINSRMKFEEKKRDTSALVNKEVDFIGQHIIATRKANGVVETIEDFTTAPSYPKWKQASIDKLTSNEYHMTQILTDQGYVLGRTLEEAQEKDPTVTKENFIKVDMSGDKPVPELTEDQEKEAKKIVGDLIDSQITRKEDETQGFNNQDRIDKIKKETASKSGRVDAFNKIFNPERSQDALNTIDTDSTYDNIQSIQMVDKDGNNVEKADYTKAESIIVQYYDPEKKEMVDGKIRVKDEDGKVKSGEEIVMEMVIKSGIDAQDLTAYKEAFLKKKGNKFNEFKGIENYQRKASVLKESGNIEVPLGKSSYPASQAISNVLKEDFKDDEGGLVALQELTKAKEEENAEKESEADKKLDQYKWSQITNMVNAAFKPRLRGKAFEFNIGSDGKLQVIYQSKAIDLGITKDGIGNDGARLINVIEAKINNANTPSSNDSGGINGMG